MRLVCSMIVSYNIWSHILYESALIILLQEDVYI